MTPKVSIIVPVYNAENVLRRCVDSILNQEYTDFELILVDDGSKDSSGAICDEYAGKDARVQVIHKENSGVSHSRNLALDRARGAYLQFLDSDDWITPDATKLFVRAAEENNCDMVIAYFYRVVGERVSPKGDIEEDGVLTREEFAAHMMENPADFYYGVLWNKLYRRDIVEKYKLRMDTKISWCEDFMFNLEYILHAKRFYALHAPVYYYVKTKGSLVSQGASLSGTIRMKLSVFEYYNKFYKHVLDEEDYEKNKLQVYRFFIDAAGDGMVAPAIIPGGKKLGAEKNFVNTELVEEDGNLMDAYRDRKLLEHYLERAALKYDVTLREAKVLMCIAEQTQWNSRKELADLLNMSRSTLTIVLQKLIAKGYIKIEDVKEITGRESKRRRQKNRLLKAEEQEAGQAEMTESIGSDADTDSADRGTTKRIKVLVQEDAEGILQELAVAEQDYENAKFAGFEEEERLLYDKLSRRVQDNIVRILK